LSLVSKYWKSGVRQSGHRHELKCRLRCLVAEGKWIGPWESNKFNTATDIKMYPSGCKVVFQRQLTVDGQPRDAYQHTSIVLHIGDDSFVIEAKKLKERGIFSTTMMCEKA